MKSEHRRFVLLRKIFEPWQWKRRKKRNRFEQTSRTLQRKISMRSTKDQLVKKRRSYACETQCFPVEPSGCRRDSPGLDEKGKGTYRYGQRTCFCGMEGTLSSRRSSNPLVVLVEWEEMWEATGHPQCFFPLNWGGTKQNHTITCMELKAKANDWRENLSLSRNNFCGPRSDFVRQEALVTTTSESQLKYRM
ncbi:hypothetical protein TNCV_672261 [Trichonephila clavipes]|nr:hypothetical protein TNCV_672261 [Trichonephila clavipes]